MIRVKYSVLSDLLLKKEDLNAFFKATFNLSNENYDRVAKSKVDRFIGSHNDRFNVKCRGNKTFFHSKNKDWLDRELICDEEELLPDDNNNENDDDIAASSEPKRRKLKAFEQCAERTKNERCAVLRESVPHEQIQKTFLGNLRREGQSLDAKIIEKLLQMNTDEKKKVLREIERDIEPRKYTKEEGLALFIDCKMTKAQYELIAHSAAAKNSPIYPPYNNILEAKKECYPSMEFIDITDVSVTIELQALLDITCRRLVKALGEELFQNSSELIFSYKWGMDGASGQSQHKQRFKNCTEKASDSSMILISLVVLRIQDSSSTEIWRNKDANSTKHCRPIKFLFAKDDKTIVVREHNAMKDKIKALISTPINVNGRVINGKHQLIMTMVDGKTVNQLSDISSSNCTICNATPTQMKDFKGIDERASNTDNFEFGLSTLHCWIRFLECILKIAFKITIRKWKATNQMEKDTVQDTKQSIQKVFRRKKGLLLSVVKVGAGTTNDGNTARRFFNEAEFAAEETGVDVRLINRFRVILGALSSAEEVDVDEFERYCRATADLYNELYDWYIMPPTVHKVLFHGFEVIASLSLPIGLYSEEAQEARNKDFKRIREHNTRKMSRYETNTDIMNGLLISSDPYISSIRKQHTRTKKPFDEEILQLLTKTTDT